MASAISDGEPAKLMFRNAISSSVNTVTGEEAWNFAFGVGVFVVVVLFCGGFVG